MLAAPRCPWPGRWCVSWLFVASDSWTTLDGAASKVVVLPTRTSGFLGHDPHVPPLLGRRMTTPSVR